jgi:hypothetical protein
LVGVATEVCYQVDGAQVVGMVPIQVILPV